MSERDRRCDDAPAASTVEVLVRRRLLDVVAGRWSRPVTAIVAGAGFGKSTLIGQALAEHRAVPTGVDLHLRLGAADAHAVRLAQRLLERLGAAPVPAVETDRLVDLVLDVCWSRAPTPISLVFDDVHELPSGCDGLAFLGELVRRLPGNTHLVLGSRVMPPVGLARLAVAGQAIVLRDSDLRFTDTEVEEFARLRRVPVERIAAADGWPALAELQARATGVGSEQYVWEEVLSLRSVDERARLVEIAALGGADSEVASAVAGQAVDLDQLLGAMPLAARSDAGWWELHEVIAEPILAQEPPKRIADIRRRGGVHAREGGDTDRAVRLLIAAGAHDEALACLRADLVKPVAPGDPHLAAEWAALVPVALDREPEVLLLHAIATTVADPERAYALAEDAVAAFSDRGDVDGELGALARLGSIAYALADATRFAPHFVRISELAQSGYPGALPLDAAARGGLCIMVGDLRGAEAVLAPVIAELTHDPTQGLMSYMLARAQVGRGRFREAERTVRAIPEPDQARMRDGILGVELAIAQGLGAPDAVFEQLRCSSERDLEHGALIVRRTAQSRSVVALATIGDLDGARRALAELERIGPATDATVDEELTAVAATAVLAGDEEEAARVLARVPDRGVFFPPLDALVLFFVLRPELRDRYAALDLEGVHARRREFAAAFVAARDGDPELLARFEWPNESVMRWFAPAPWLIEAAVRSAAAGGVPPIDLVRRIGPSQRHVVRRFAGSTDPEVARIGAEFSVLLGPAASDRVALRVLGPFEVDVDGLPSDASALRRERVRALLGLLVLRRSVRRDEAAGALWPGLDDEPAMRNLRVTLTHLLKLIEPSRERGAPSYFIHQERERLTLREDPALSVDLWDFEWAMAEAERFERAGAPARYSKR